MAAVLWGVASAGVLDHGLYNFTHSSGILLRHCNYVMYASAMYPLAEDFVFFVGPALNGNPNAVSISPLAFPASFIAPAGGQLDGGVRAGIVFGPNADDASWVPSRSNGALVLTSESKNPRFPPGSVLSARVNFTSTGGCDALPRASDVVIVPYSAAPVSDWMWSETRMLDFSVAVTADVAAPVSTTPRDRVLGCHTDSGYTQQTRGFDANLLYGASWEPGTTSVYAWTDFATPGLRAMAKLDPTTPFNGAPSMRFQHGGGAVGAFGKANGGLGNEGLVLQAGMEYDAMAWVLAPQGTVLYLALWDNTTGTALASAQVQVAPLGSWQRVTAQLVPSQATTCRGVVGPDPTVDCGDMGPQPGHVCVKCGGQFRVGVATPGVAWVGYSELLPGAWGLFEGLRVQKQAVDTLRAMGTAVVRQGGTFSQGVAWQDFRGMPWQRRAMQHTWGDSLFGGWGPFEFVAMCNAAGITPILTLRWDQSVDDWADLVEYCWGDAANTTWGRQRAADGYAAPLRVSTFELGNEEENPNFAPQAIAMQQRAIAIGAPALRFMYPTNDGVSAATIAALQAGGIAAEQVMPDIHIGAGGALDVAEGVFAAHPWFLQSAINCETNAGTHDMARGALEALDLIAWLAAPPTLSGRMVTRTASFCMERSGHYDAFDQGLTFFLPNASWLQPPGIVHAILSSTWGGTTVLSEESIVPPALHSALPFNLAAAPRPGRPDAKLRDASARRGRGMGAVAPNWGSVVEVDGLGGVYVRMANAYPIPLNASVSLSGVPPLGSAVVTVLAADSGAAANTPAQPTLIAPSTTTVAVAGWPMTVTMPPFSFITIAFNTTSSSSSSSSAAASASASRR